MKDQLTDLAGAFEKASAEAAETAKRITGLSAQGHPDSRLKALWDTWRVANQRAADLGEQFRTLSSAGTVIDSDVAASNDDP